MADVSAGHYVLDWAALAVLALSLGFSAVSVRRRLLPDWEGAPGHLVEAIIAVASLIWLAELLGVVNLLYAWSLVGSAALLAALIATWRRRTSDAPSAGGVEAPSAGGVEAPSAGGVEAPSAGGVEAPSAGGVEAPSAGGVEEGTRGRDAMSLVALAVVAVVFAHWGLTAKDALGRGIFNFDSLWYHLPFAVEMAHSHSVTGIHYTETVFTNWFYPQNSELLHAAGILLTQRDTLSLFLNFGWLGLAFLAAWCIGRPYGRGPLAVVAAAVVLECHTLVVREPGAAKNDLMAAALLLAAIAILINRERQVARGTGRGGPSTPPSTSTGRAGQMLPLAVAGLATGLAVGTKSTALAMAAVLTLAVIALAPVGRRWAAAGWWFAAALAGGGFWYARNLIVAGNPLPQLERIGPLDLPHPERLQSGRPDFSIAHYATDTGVWQHYFGPGLHHAFGLLWPLVVGGAIAGGLLALLLGRRRALRWIGAVVLVGLLAYMFTPLSAAGAQGAPTGFAINIRYAIPAVLAGLTLLPVALYRLRAGPHVSPAGGGRREGGWLDEAATQSDRTRGPGALSWADWALLGTLLAILILTDRPDAVLRDPDRLFAWGLAVLMVVIPTGLVYARRRGISRRAIAGGFAALLVAVAAIGYPVQRDYLRDRFGNENLDTSIPGMHLDSAYRWARGVDGARIGLAGTTAGFLDYGLYGPRLSNRVRYLGVKGPHGAFNAIPDCRRFRAAVNAADLDYLVTAPFLNFISPGKPIASPEAGWLRGEMAVRPIDRSGPVTVWRVEGSLDPAGCGPANAPLRRIPQQPGS